MMWFSDSLCGLATGGGFANGDSRRNTIDADSSIDYPSAGRKSMA